MRIKRNKNSLPIIILSCFVSAELWAGVVINEVCYHADPNSDTGREWIELFNYGSTDCDISGWDLYPGRTPHFIIPDGTNVAAGAHLMVYLRKDGINNGKEIYEGTAGISSNMPNTKGSAALFSSASRDTMLDFVQYGAVGQSYEATAGTAGLWIRGDFVDTVVCGGTLGLIRDGLDSNRSGDWKGFEKPTPGFANQPKPRDIAVAKISLNSDVILPGQPFVLTTEIINAGLDTAFSPVVILFEDADGDSALDADERKFSELNWDFLQNARTASFLISGLDEGQFNIAVEASCNEDGISNNNYCNLPLTVGSPLGINEIMYNPHSGQAEWIEIYNRSEKAVDIKNWKFENDTLRSMIISTSRIVAPQNYLILTQRENQPLTDCPKLVPAGGWPALENGGGLIALSDLRGCRTEMVNYQSTWGARTGVSLEKINPILQANNPASWGLSGEPSGATPGRQNSIYAAAPTGTANLSVGPNPFSPDDDSHEEYALLKYNLPWDQSVVNITIFDRLGRKVRSLLNNYRTGSTDYCIWDGLDDQRRKCPLGLYVILLESGNSNGSGSISAKCTVVLAGRL